MPVLLFRTSEEVLRAPAWIWHAWITGKHLNLWEANSLDHSTSSSLVSILKELSLANEIFCMNGLSLRSSLQTDKQLNSTFRLKYKISNNLNLNFHLFCSLMRVNPKVNDLVLQVSFYAHTHNSKVTQAISCMLNEKLTSLFAIKPLILLKRLSLPPTRSFHTHPQLGGIGRGKKLPCQVSEWVSLPAEVITFW